MISVGVIAGEGFEMPDAADAGGLAAFEGLLRSHYEAAFRLALSFLGSRAEAEDAVQEASLDAWRRLSQLRDAAAERGWFLAIVANRCRATRRRRWWSVLPLLASPSPALGAAAASTDDSLDVRRALGRLSDEQRLVVVLRFYLDLPHAEIAAITGSSEEAVRARLHRALRRLERTLGTSGELGESEVMP